MVRRAVIEAVAITAAISVIIAGIMFYFLYNFIISRRSKKSKLDSSFRREGGPGVTRVGFRQQSGVGLIVEEDGLDVIYLRKMENGHFGGCFSKVWYNPMDEEHDKRMDKPISFDSHPVQEIPLLKDPCNVYHHAPPPEIKKTPPSPPPTPPPSPPPLIKEIFKPPPSIPRKENFRPPPPPAPPKLRPAPPPPPLKRKDIMISSNKPPIPPTSMERMKGKSEILSNKNVKEIEDVQMKLKPLHWEKVTANADHSMVWNEINDGSFRFDDHQMEALFGYTTTNNHKSPDKNNKLSKNSNSFQSPQIFILDPRKSQNTSIILKSLSISRHEILDSLIEGRGLNADTLEKLTKISPTKDETTKILHFDGNISKLADGESFLYHILKAVPSAFIRLNAMLFRSNYDHEILHLKECLQTLESGCKELRTRGIFFKLLEAILKAGNRMNAGTNRGNAQGFDLSALRRLSDVKSTNGKTTLLHFVVEQVVRAEGKRCLINKNVKITDIKNSNEEKDIEHLRLGLEVVMESLNTQFTNVKKSATIMYDSLIAICSILTTRVDEIKDVLSRDIESGQFLREMKGFLEDCEDELKVVREEQMRVMELVRKTTVYYQAGGSKEKGVNLLQIFVIVKDFLNMVEQACGEMMKNVEKVKVGNGSSNSSSPPLSPTIRSPVRFQNLEMYFRAQRPSTSSSDSEDDF